MINFDLGNKPRKEPKQVIFSDGIRPGGDLTDLTEPAETAPVYRRFSRKRVDKLISGLFIFCNFICVLLKHAVPIISNDRE